MLRQVRLLRITVIGVGLPILLVLVIGLHNTATAGGVTLRPPYNGTYRLTAFFDHHYPNYVEDNEITIYTGESVASCSPHCYHGHAGIDWSMVTGTPVLAAADGIVRERAESNTGYGNRIVIEHANGYRTLYGHLRVHNPPNSPAFNVTVGQRVAAGAVIGWSGNTGASSGPHLHFGVYRGANTADERNVTDPFGWRGSQPDPLRNFPNAGQGHTASCLWRSRDEDPISCADIVVEDGGQGFYRAGTWNESVMGNGYHMYYRRNTTDNSIYASWTSTSTIRGLFKIYTYIEGWTSRDWLRSGYEKS